MRLMQAQSAVSEKVMKEVCEVLTLKEEIFMMSMQTYAQNPQMAQFIAAAQQGKFKQTTPSGKGSLPRETVIKCIDVNIELLK